MAPDIDALKPAPIDPIDQRKNVLKRAVNQKVLVPNILSLMPAWP